MSNKSEMSTATQKALFEVMLGKMTENTRFSRYREAFDKTVSEKNDSAAIGLLELIKESFILFAKVPEDTKEHYVERVKKENGMSDFAEFLKDIYLTLPTSSRKEERYRKPTTVCPLLNTKKVMMEYIAKEWKPVSQSPESIDAFQFMIASYVSFNWTRRLDWMSDWDAKANELKRKPLKEEYEMIFEIFRERAKDTFKKKDFNEHHFWMNLPNVPKAFFMALAYERAFQLNHEEILRDMTQNELLRHFDIEKRSEPARLLTGDVLKKIVAMDNACHVLCERMQPMVDRHTPYRDCGESFSSITADETIGKSELVVGDVDFNFPELDKISVNVAVFDNLTEAFVREVAGRAGRHIEEWRENYPYLVTLCVSGGETNIKLEDIITPIQTKFEEVQ